MPETGFADRQRVGLASLTSLSVSTTGEPDESLFDGDAVLASRVRRYGTAERNSDPAAVPARTELHGRLEPPAPSATYRARTWLAVIPLTMLLAGSLALHWRLLGHHIPAGALAAWVIVTAATTSQCLMSWFHQPATGPSAPGRVAVVVPCYNEDPALLECVLASLRLQTRQPDWVIVTDDASDKADYSALIAEYTEVIWLQHQINLGKKHAQVTAWQHARGADYIITVDSDSALEPRAIEEILRPFSDKRVTGVAGLETARNWHKNVLTLAIAARSLAFQLFAMSSQSVARSVLICPGAFSAYPAWLLRKCERAYLGETFCSQPCRLGDDTMLTFLASMHGRVVQQPTAFSFPVYPEKLQHHIRQWVRWMRASTIRQLWRLRYLPLISYGWWFTIWQIGTFTAGVAASVLVIVAWPASIPLALGGLGGLVAWPLVLAVRLATITRSDLTRWQMLRGVALMPLAALWYLLVLRQLRFWGMLTCDRQGWNTRSEIEVSA